MRRLAGALAAVLAIAALAALLLRHHAPVPRAVAAARAPRPAARVVGPPRAVRVRPSRAAVPILMYHVIAPPPAGAPFPGLYVPQPEFASQMAALHAAGFHAVTLDRVLRAWDGRARLPAHPIVLTFDNGYRTQYTQALPVLERLHWPAVENLQLAGLPPRQGGLLPREIRALVRRGWEVDTQGYSHADLPALDPASLTFQIDEAKRLLARDYGIRPHWFCYPSGKYDTAVVAAVHAAGFVGATTVTPGWAEPRQDRYALPRLRVLGGTTGAGLLALIRAWRGSA